MMKNTTPKTLWNTKSKDANKLDLIDPGQDHGLLGQMEKMAQESYNKNVKERVKPYETRLTEDVFRYIAR